MQGQFEHCNFCFKGEDNINFVNGKFRFQDAFRKSQISKFIDPQIQFVKKNQYGRHERSPPPSIVPFSRTNSLK